jgi:hypothetical protein
LPRRVSIQLPPTIVTLLHAVGLIESTRLIENPEPDDRRQFRVAHLLARKTLATQP